MRLWASHWARQRRRSRGVERRVPFAPLRRGLDGGPAASPGALSILDRGEGDSVSGRGCFMIAHEFGRNARIVRILRIVQISGQSENIRAALRTRSGVARSGLNPSVFSDTAPPARP